MTLRLTFPRAQISELAKRYVAEDATRSVPDAYLEDIVQAVKSRRSLMLKELHLVAQWKSPRSAGLVLENDSEYVEEVTRIALSTDSERLRIEVLTVLDGVGWPMASVVLHWFHRDDYPILDFRALASVGAPGGQHYDFTFWRDYTDFCRNEARLAEATMRNLDRALWQHSYESDKLAAPPQS